MKSTINNVSIICALLFILGCQDEAETSYHAEALQTDERYSREISFDLIGIRFPIEEPGTFIRIDDPVADLDTHQQDILQELGIQNARFSYSNHANNGRSMHLAFADGKECVFIWVLKTADDRLSRVSIEHEKYHALCRIAPSGISTLSEAVEDRGFRIDFHDHDEELSATLVQILSLHLLGVPLEEISGSELVVKATAILRENRSNKSDQATPKGAPVLQRSTDRERS